MAELETIITTLKSILKDATLTENQFKALNHAISFMDRLNAFLRSFEALGMDFTFEKMGE